MQLNPSAEKIDHVEEIWVCCHQVVADSLKVLCCCNLKVFFFLILLNKNSKVISLNNIFSEV